MVTKINTATVVGLSSIKVEVEVDVASRGLPSFTIVGLPDKGVQEAKERVKSALSNTAIQLPPKRITVNLSPSDVPKKGSGFDLPIAVGLLVGTGSIPPIDPNTLFMGELSLDGEIKPTAGILPAIMMAKAKKLTKAYIPRANHTEAAIIEGVDIYTPDSINQLVMHLTGQIELQPQKNINLSQLLKTSHADIDMAEIIGQSHAKRALEIAAAGSHNIFFNGMPGSGKTMLARALAGILPMLSAKESLELTNIYSISGELSSDHQLITQRPFRSPHHTTSKVGIIGGGTYPKPGEITLSHRGVLFLDELPEFPRSVIESLRQPLEDGLVHITRANQSAVYPSKCMLVAAANPCPCGYYGHPTKACRCTMAQINRYNKKVSGPILDRIDIHVHVSAVDIKKLAHKLPNQEASQTIQARVESAHQVQRTRFKSDHKNAHMSNKQIKKFCQLDDKTQLFFTTAAKKLDLSARSYYKTLKVARTIADLSGSEQLAHKHIAEALQYRPSLKN